MIEQLEYAKQNKDKDLFTGDPSFAFYSFKMSFSIDSSSFNVTCVESLAVSVNVFAEKK